MPLTTLFLDMNAYFASVEQQLRVDLRNKPVVVVPVLSDTSCCIAASYEAKRFGVKTGTGVGKARQLCPQLRIVKARPALYVRMHHRVIAAVETCLPVAGVCSIDEMYCRLIGRERQPDQAEQLARNVKEAIAQRVGPYLRCSVGVASNRFLAKVATNLEKPDGLVVLTPADRPGRLEALDLIDLPGIGRRMLRRLHKRSIRTVRELFDLSEDQLADIWKSVIGRQWWYWLRGEELYEPPTHRRSVGHSHVLAPEFRSHPGARAVLVRLLYKAAIRLRALGYWATRMHVAVSFLPKGRWSADTSLGMCQDTPTMLEALAELWRDNPGRGTPFAVGVTLYNLVAPPSAPLPLYPAELRRLQLCRTMDDLNNRFGRHVVYFGSMHNARRSAPMRISFTNIPDPNLPA